MHCYQCEQAARGTGCVIAGVCGKDAQTAGLQDLLVEVAKGVAQLAVAARADGVRDPEVARWLIEALFTTVTNVDFDPVRVTGWIDRGLALRERLRAASSAARAVTTGPALLEVPAAIEARGALGQAIGVGSRLAKADPTITGLQELVLYGLKGLAAYADHALVLGRRDDAVDDFVADCLAFLAGDAGADALVGMALKVGEVNLRVMELLDDANTGTYGHPEPTAVRVTPRKGKAILVSGHDLKDLEELLVQTAGTGIQVYTHGEMLPAHAYPGLKKFPHLAGNYGGAWQVQQEEFAAFPGAVLMTTNCIQRPMPSYAGRIFTSGLVAWPGVTHCAGRDFRPVIEAALAASGFESDGPEKTILVGFGRNAVLSVAPQVIDAVKAGAIRHFFLVGGCDGAKPGRDYYTRFVEMAPRDTVILTLACGKYRFNQLELGDIGGIPRLLDVGQCNDAYSAIRIALALADAFGTDVNHLPLSLVLSWYEQKAVCILLTLLHLGIRNIRIGPSLPAFLTPAVVQILVDTFGLTPIGTPEGDLATILGQPAQAPAGTADFA